MLTNFNRLREVFSKVSRQTNDFIEGYVSIKQEDEINLYTYNISIDFNDITPKVIELENKIPRTIERHLFPNRDWSFCLGYLLQVYSFWINSNFDCLLFVNELVIPFLANQYYYDRNGEWFIKGYNHDENGLIEFYSERFNTNEKEIILESLINILKGKKYGRNIPCFCGSGLKHKHCHFKRNLTSYEIDLLKRDYGIIRNYKE